MKRHLFIWLLLGCLVLAGCHSSPEETQPPSTAAATDPAPTETVWQPFTGALRLYTYYHETGDARDWEEDILYMSELYLDDYTQLTPFPSRVEIQDDVYYDTERFSPQLREYYLNRINELIPRLDTMEETDILFYLQETVAACRDAHMEVYVQSEDNIHLFPLYLEPLYHEDGSWGLYVMACKAGDRELPFARLTAINDVPVEDAVNRLAPLLSYENEYWLLQCVTNSAILCPEYLSRVGIIGPEEDSASFTFEADDGTVFTRKLHSLSLFQYRNYNFDIYGMYAWANHPFTTKAAEANYYYEYIEEANSIFCRIHRFVESPQYTVLQFGNELLSLSRAAEGIDNLILDLRANPGGYQTLGFPEFFSVLNRMDIGTIYVLIDNGTFSNGVITAGTISTRLENAVLVGSPAGQPVNFYGSVEDITTPNEKITFRLPGAWHIIDPEDSNDALMPDIQVLQTLEDYKNGRDTVLEAVWAMIKE